jgi:DNA-binding transcriptional regulator LsrR (DeoR family)
LCLRDWQATENKQPASRKFTCEFLNQDTNGPNLMLDSQPSGDSAHQTKASGANLTVLSVGLAPLERRTGERVLVADVAGPPNLILELLGRATATLPGEISTDDDVLGFAWTRTLEVMTHHPGPLKARAVVQLCGAFPGAGSGRTSVEIVRDVARPVEGSAFFYYAPFVTPDAPAADAIRRQADVKAAQAMYAQVSKAVVTTGSWQAGHFSLWDAVGSDLRDDAVAAGAVAEICGGIFLDRDGTPVATTLSDVTIGITPKELKAIPEVIGVAFGVEKSSAIRRVQSAASCSP